MTIRFRTVPAPRVVLVPPSATIKKRIVRKRTKLRGRATIKDRIFGNCAKSLHGATIKDRIFGRGAKGRVPPHATVTDRIVRELQPTEPSR